MVSKHSGRTNTEPPREDREWFIRENALAIVEELEARIENYKREIKLHLKGKKSLRKELARARDETKRAEARAEFLDNFIKEKAACESASPPHAGPA